MKQNYLNLNEKDETEKGEPVSGWFAFWFFLIMVLFIITLGII